MPYIMGSTLGLADVRRQDRPPLDHMQRFLLLIWFPGTGVLILQRLCFALEAISASLSSPFLLRKLKIGAASRRNQQTLAQRLTALPRPGGSICSAVTLSPPEFSNARERP